MRSLLSVFTWKLKMIGALSLVGAACHPSATLPEIPALVLIEAELPDYIVSFDRKRRTLHAVEEIPASVSLPERKFYYRIPQEAERFLREVDTEALRDFSFPLYFTARADAEWEILKNERRHAENDFVSGYDFRRASLDHLPFQLVANAGITGRQWMEFVDQLIDRGTELSVFEFPVSWRVTEQSEFELMQDSPFEKKDLASARFQDGQLRGVVVVQDGVLQVDSEAAHPDVVPLPIIIRRIAYSDVNGDGFLDAILRLTVGDQGAVAVLTRSSPEQTLFDWVEPLGLAS